MKYQSSNTGIVYEITFNGKYSTCPECSHKRKKKTDKCVTYFADEDRAYCHHCLTTFFRYKPEHKKEYVLPNKENITDLTPTALQFFTKRGIGQQVLKDFGVYSTKEYMPQFQNEVNVIAFPFYYDGKLINIKFRGPNKSFKLVSGAELILMNIDALREKEVIIVEGEMDMLTFMQVGVKNVMSVPNGANNNLEYLDNYIHLFDAVETVYVATDVDAPGLKLRDEIVRRVGSDKCKIIAFKECKDANEYFLKYGKDELLKLLDEAKYVKTKGIVYVDDILPEVKDFFENGDEKGLEIDHPEIDQFITWETRRLAIVTGVPGSGKSDFVDYLVCKLNILHGWKAAYFTPENYPLKYHYEKIFRKLVGKSYRGEFMNEEVFDTAAEYMKNNFFYVLDEDNLTLDTILINAKILVKSKGIKILVIDPYNKVEHQYDNKISETQYIGKFLDKLILFGKLNDLLIFLVAHPRKMQRGDIPTLYDISGSANFYNKCDYGFTVHRITDEEGIMTNDVQVHWQKIKFLHLGKQGISNFRYNYINGRFEDVGSDVDHWDYSNWITKEKNNEIPF